MKPWMRWASFVLAVLPLLAAVSWAFSQTKRVPAIEVRTQELCLKVAALEATQPLILKALERIENKIDRRRQ